MLELKFAAMRAGIAAQERLKEEHSSSSVLWGEIEGEGMNIPLVLVLSSGARAVYEVDNFTFSSYTIKPEEGHYIITETGVDSLAILRVGSHGQVEVQGGNVNEWLPIDSKKQRLGLAIITAKEGNNSMQRFWAKAFAFNKE